MSMTLLEEVLSEDVFITSVGFNEDSVEITFLESREQGERDMMARTMVLVLESDERIMLVAEIQERLRDLIDVGYVSLRNPPREIKSAKGRDGIHQRMAERNSSGDDGDES